tara:strand:- start:966 stop:1280 length:315 start_codon:yes stop_codon:yes gene_type:complete
MIKQKLYDEVAIEIDQPSLADLDDYRWSSVFLKAMKRGQRLEAEAIAFTMPREAMLDSMGVELAISLERGLSDEFVSPAARILKRVFRARFLENQKETITVQIL